MLNMQDIMQGGLDRLEDNAVVTIMVPTVEHFREITIERISLCEERGQGNLPYTGVTAKN